MRTLTIEEPAGSLNNFVAALLQNPIRNDRFTAVFERTGPYHGNLHFQRRRSDGEAVVQWEVYNEQQGICGRLKYNDRFVLLHACGEDFRTAIAERLPVF